MGVVGAGGLPGVGSAGVIGVMLPAISVLGTDSGTTDSGGSRGRLLAAAWAERLREIGLLLMVTVLEVWLPWRTVPTGKRSE